MDEGSRSKAPIIAIGAAIVALVTSVVAVVLLLTRSPAASPVAAAGSGAGSGSGSAATPAPPTSSIVEASVAAADVLKLKQRETIDDATDGVEVTDEALRTALKLRAGDIISAINGRKVTRELDIYDAMMGVTMAETTIVYVDVIRDGKPLLVRWNLDVSMRTAWRSSLSLGSSPYGSSTYGSSGTATDPAIVASVKKLDDTEFEAPRNAVDALFVTGNTAVRMVPSIRGGVANGVKLYAIRPSSIFSAFGFENGDTIKSINSDETTSANELAEAYRSHKYTRTLEIEVERRGSPITITITVK